MIFVWSITQQETRDLRARIKLNDHVNRVCLFMTSLHGGSESGNESTTSTPRSEDTSSSQSTMATGFNLPPPPPLEIHDDNIAEKWKKFRLAWSNYSLATELNKKTEAIQVATLLTVIGEEARDVYSTFDWSDEGNKSKIEPVLQQFADYCQPRKNVPFQRYRFNKRAQEAGESYDQYKTALRKLAEGCEFHTITSEEILRDRLIFGIRDVKVRERLLRESQLTLKKTDEICRASESTAAQLKEVSEGDTVSAVNFRKKPWRPRGKKGDTGESTKECGNCGRIHEPNNCFARGKTCGNRGRLNHFAAVCRSGKRRDAKSDSSVKAIDQEANHGDDSDEIYVVSEIAVVTLDDTQLVTLCLESGNYLRFQPDTGAQCNVIPVHLYKKAANDPDLKQIKPTNSAISAYGGSKLLVLGQVTLRVWCDNVTYRLDCKLVDNKDIRPILGRKACIGMNIVKYTDNDAINKPTTGNASVYSVEDNLSGMSKESLVKQFPEVFAEEVGQLDGEYHIKVDPTVSPVQHPPPPPPSACFCT